MINIKVKVLSRKTERQLKRLLKNLNNRVKLNKRIGIKALSEIDKQFRTEGSNFGTPWKPLKKETLAARRAGKGRGNAKILRDTGRLAASFTSKANQKQVVIGTNLKYSHNHQAGTTVPERPMLPDDQVVAYKKIAEPVVEDFIKNEVRKANK